ncbi:hypothetical protein BD779DRAFT_1524577 [Infundibulicybe gibba]|nr:hypothetical protein BD779DRAFT_1524577 [Infundibulicybe gibba]
MLGFLPAALHALLTTLLWKQEPTPLSPAPLRFQLRHEHATSASSRNIFSDLPASFISADPHIVSTRPIRSHRPNSFAQFTAARHRSFEQGQSAADLGWSDVDVHGPDVRRRETLLTLAKMTYNTYYQPGDKDWYDLSDEGWNSTYPHGWEPHADGLRGHVLGTSAGWLAGGGGPTVGPTWPGVCPCNTGGYHCDQSCVESSLQDEDGFYQVGTNLYNNVTYMYPNANIWIVGHSLGGALSSLLGATFGVPVVAFEAPRSVLQLVAYIYPCQYVSFSYSYSYSNLTITAVDAPYHTLYHTGDVSGFPRDLCPINSPQPIPMGACTGVTSVCAIGGYAMETRCRLGNTILYDTVNKLNWGVSVQRHPIRVVIEEILNKDWDPDSGIEVPEPQISEGAVGDDCIDCFAWEFGDFKKASISEPSAGGCARDHNGYNY